MKKIISMLLLLCISLSLCSCGTSAAVVDCEKLINNIGEITLESEDAIIAAEKAFSSLSEKEKDKIPESEKTLFSARANYTSLLNNTVNSLISSINSIGEVSLESEGIINSTRNQYNKLPLNSRNLITNYDILVTAEEKLQVIKEEYKEQQITRLLKNFDVHEDKIEEIIWLNHKSTPTYIDSRSYIIPYIGIKTNINIDNAWICIRYNCVCGELLLWDTLKLVVDEEHFSNEIGYFKTTFDTSGFAYWEYYDEVLSLNQSVSSEELTLLKKIADSTETIIRFQGSSTYYDLVVTQQDKDIINDVLELYSLLIG